MSVLGADSLTPAHCHRVVSRSLWPFLILVTLLPWHLLQIVALPKPVQGQNPSGQPPPSSATPLAFAIRFKNGQTRFRQGETITLQLGYGAELPGPAARSPVYREERPGLALDELHLEPRSGVVDPLRDFLGSVGVWDGPPPRSEPFVEQRGPWTEVQINEWFRFAKPGKYILSVFAHPVRDRVGAYWEHPGTITITSNAVEFEIIPADPGWQMATLQKALGLLDSKLDYQRQQEGCRMARFLTTRSAVDAMIKHYADEGVCGTEYQYGLFAFPDRAYAVRKMEDGILDPAVPISAAYLDTLARLSAYLHHPEFLPDDKDHNLGKMEWLGSGPLAAHWDLIEMEEQRGAEELVAALGRKTVKPRAVSLKAIFDSPLLGRPTLLESSNPTLLDGLRKELAEVFTDLPVSEQYMLLWSRWPNIASPYMIPVLRHLCENPPQGDNDQFVAAVLARLNELVPSEGRALILTEMKRAHPRLDLRFVQLLPDKEIPELDEPLAEKPGSLERRGQHSGRVDRSLRHAYHL